MMKKILLLFVIFGAISGIHLFAQEITPSGLFVVNVDYARFHYDDQSGYLEIYYGLFPHLLTYQFVEEKWVAGVQLKTRLINDDTQLLTINENVDLPVVVADTSETTFKFPTISQAGYAIAFGNYTLEVMAADALNPLRRDSTSLAISFNAYPNSTVVSDLELCGSIKPSKQTNNPFYKNSLEVLPNPTLIFGVTAYPVLFHYLELYNLDVAETYTVKTQILDFQDKMIRESSKPHQYGVKSTIEVGTTPVTAILSGKYRFCLSILSKNSQELAQTEKTFYIYNPHLEAPELSVDEAFINEFAGISDKELTNEFLQAKYIATDDEIKTFQLINTEVGKREFLAKFWSNALKGRPGRPPISRADYLRMIDRANEMYRELGREGWQTDRGRVFILYGQPDDIERYPSISESKPYEIWRYHRIENGVEFVFVERLGYGHYEMIHSTKRGELWNDNWKDYLR